MSQSILIEGCPLSGKTSLLSSLQPLLPNIEIKVKGIFFEQHEKHWSLWNKANRPFNTVIIVLEADPVCLLEREKELKQGKNEYTTSSRISTLFIILFIYSVFGTDLIRKVFFMKRKDDQSKSFTPLVLFFCLIQS